MKAEARIRWWRIRSKNVAEFREDLRWALGGTGKSYNMNGSV